MTVRATSQRNRPEGSQSYTVPYHMLKPSDLNPRKRFDEAALVELAHSILEHDLLQPLVVRLHLKGDGHYEIVAGERRYRALSWLLEHDLLQPLGPATS